MLLANDISTRLPNSIQSWKDLPTSKWSEVWEPLRPFFEARGYYTYQVDEDSGMTIPDPRRGPPASESFGLFGDRDENYKSTLEPFPLIVAARDALNRDVAIKVVSKGEENIEELRILRLLNSEPLQSDPMNATVRVLDFIELGDWTFVVMPFCDSSHFLLPMRVWECLDIIVQTLEGLAFLHANRIAHLDISFENILINHHGRIPMSWTVIDDHVVEYYPPPEFRSTFPIRYFFMDFGYSLHFDPKMPLSACVAEPRSKGREHKAPETSLERYNPFAADIYQIGRMFYAWFFEIIPVTNGIFELLKDMTDPNPSNRPSAECCLDRLLDITTSASHESLSTIVSATPGEFHDLPDSIEDVPAKAY